MENLDLSGTWTLEPLDGRLPSCSCGIPGDIHSALIGASLIPHPYWKQQELDVQYLHALDWKLTRTFELDDSAVWADAVLRTDRVDTIAEIRINGQSIGRCADAFQSYRFSLPEGLLKTGTNELTVVLYSAQQEALKRREQLRSPAPHVAYPVQSPARNLVRKPQCHSGWDWGPCLMVSGIYGSITLEHGMRPRIEWITADTKRLDDTRWQTAVRLGVTGGDPGETVCTARIAELSAESAALLQPDGTAELILDNLRPQLWQPAGYGAARLYELEAEAGGHRVIRRIGFREAELEAADDRWGRSMTFRINGVPVFAKGANWIPSDALPSSQTREAALRLLTDARRAEMNMIRVWGGGQYEADWFYELCDQLGLMVWQDCMFSCAVYPADGPFLEEVEKEITCQVRRLQHHPSIVIWCGNNENLGAISWFEETRNQRDRCIVDYDRLYERTIGETVQKLDPRRPWWPSSPSAGPRDYTDCWHDDSKGDMHFWDVWHEGRPFEAYREVVPRFCSEFGFQSFPSLPETASFTDASQRNITSPDMLHRQRSPQGSTVIISTMTRYFRMPSSFADTLYLSQVQQALAVKTAVDYWRSRRPRCMGILYWQLNDLWPAVSWSSIEYSGRWKLLHYEVKRCYAPIRLAVIPREGLFDIYGINDTAGEVRGTIQLTFRNIDGTLLEREELEAALPSAASVLHCSRPVSEKVPAKQQLLEVKCSFGSLISREIVLCAHPREMPLPRAEVKTEFSSDGRKMRITAELPAFYVWIETAEPAVLSDNGFHLLAGESREITRIDGEPLSLSRLYHLEASSRNQ